MIRKNGDRVKIENKGKGSSYVLRAHGKAGVNPNPFSSFHFKKTSPSPVWSKHFHVLFLILLAETRIALTLF